MEEPRDRYRIGVDIGGTFTDLVLADVDRRVHAVKVPSVPSDPAEGVFDALRKAADTLGVALESLLRDCALFVHGATIATNTVLEGKGARVGLLTTEGFRDSLEIRRGYRANPFDHRTPYPPVLVPRSLRRPVAGRFDREGNETRELSIDDVRAAAKVFDGADVESAAICLFNSFLNPAHEKRAEAALRESWDGDWVYASVDIAPTIGEYERTSTTVMNAYVAPRTVGYLRRLDERLRGLGLPRGILLVQNNGGAVPMARVADKPATLLLAARVRDHERERQIVAQCPQGRAFRPLAGMDAVDQLGDPLDSGADRNAVTGRHDRLGPSVAHFVRHVERPARESDRLEHHSSEYPPHSVVEFRAGLAGVDKAAARLGRAHHRTALPRPAGQAGAGNFFSCPVAHRRTPARVRRDSVGNPRFHRVAGAICSFYVLVHDP